MLRRVIDASKPLRWVTRREDAQSLLGVPGLAFGKDTNEFKIGRSHLPLIGAEGRTELLKFNTFDKLSTWEARDRFTAERGFKLRTTQQQAIDFLTIRRGGLLGDSPRLGKTLSAIMSHDPASGQLVVIGPLMARGVWLMWLRRVFPGVEIGVLLGKKIVNTEQLHKPIVFGHYDIIHAWQSLKVKIGTLVLDEAHALTNPDSLRSAGVAILALNALRVIAMTGTPVWNMPPGLWNILNLVMPGEWGSWYDFAFRYGKPEPTGYGTKYTGISYPEELTARLSEVMLRRQWIDVAEDLPPITRTVVIADLDEAAKRKLDIEAAALLEGGSKNTAAGLASYRRAASKYKIPATVAETKKTLDRNEPVVVWAWHVDTAKEIAKRIGARALCITGEDNIKVREERIAAWKAASGEGSLALVATMAVAREAIDLSHAKFCVLGELSETPAIVGQVEMRTYDPTRPMSVTFVVANHPVDHRLVQMLERKLTAASAVGVGTASDAINALRAEVFGEHDDGDMGRFLDDLLNGED